MSDLTLTAQPRTMTGRKVKRLRAEGLVPVVVYGKTQPPQTLQVGARNLEKMIKQSGISQLIEVNVEDGETYNVLFKEIQRHPVKRNFLHVDFYAVNMTETQQVSVTVNYVGTPAAMASGLMFYQTMDSVELVALPNDIPAAIEVDVSALTEEKAITIADLPEIEGVEYVGEPEEPVFMLMTTRAGVAEEEEEGVEQVEAVEEEA